MNTKILRPIRSMASLRAGMVLNVLIAVSALTWRPSPVFATDWRTRGSQREAVEGHRSNNNSDHDRSSSGDDAERAERNRQVNTINQQANEAWERRDYREALRLYKQQQKLRDGPNVRGDIANVRALMVWSEATTAADYRRAMAMRPGLFTQDNVRYVESLEADEKYPGALDASRAGDAAAAAGNYAKALGYYRTMILNSNFNTDNNRTVIADIEARVKAEQDRRAREAREAQVRIKREAEGLNVAVKIRKRINEFAASLDTALPRADLVLTKGGVVNDAMDGHKAAPLAFGDPNAPENLSEQARQGIDKEGRLKGSEPIPRDIAPGVAAAEVLPVSIPDQYRDNPQISGFKKQWEEAKIEQVAAEEQLDKIKELRKKPDANKGDLDVREVDARYSRDAAQSKKDTAVVMVKETLRTFKEKKVD